MYKIMKLILLILVSSTFALASDPPSVSVNTSKEIVRLIGTSKYSDVWDTHMTEVWKSSTTRDGFVSDMTLSRSPLGAQIKFQLLGQQIVNADPKSGYNGKVYIFNFKCEYQNITLFERAILVEEKIGTFKLAGYYATPAS